MKKLEFDNHYQIYHLPNKEKFNYSDGTSIEKYIFDSLKLLKDTTIFSNSLKAKIKDWPSRYHFSSERQNVLRPFNFTSEMKILEIGGGCGAITRYLVDTGADILSVEGSFDRAISIRERCKDSKNLKVVCANIQDLDIKEKFDVITLIGVFEYTAKYSKFSKPYIQSLEYYNSLLKPKGKLIIAIENRLGLKYFCGYNEDHLGEPYKGLENNYGKSGVKTFGKQELSNLLLQSNFKEIDFYYPFPDYKFPKVILSEKGIQTNAFNASDLISPIKVDYYSGVRRVNNSNIRLIWESVSKNNLIDNFSNSFIVVASREKSKSFFKQNLLAEHYNTHRQNLFNTKTSFEQEEDKIAVTKEKLATNLSATSNDIISHSIGSIEDYIYGSNLGNLLYNSMINDDKETFEFLLTKWISFLKENTFKTPKTLGTDELIGSFYDAIPNNIIMSPKGVLHFIDREWNFKNNLSIAYLINRCLIRLKEPASFIKKHYGSFSNFKDSIFKSNNVRPLSKVEYANFNKTENMIREHITPRVQRMSIKKLSINNIKQDLKFKLKLIYRLFFKY